jgi:hypothetical protein
MTGFLILDLRLLMADLGPGAGDEEAWEPVLNERG